MKVKAPSSKPVEEDPAVKAQRLAAEKAATDANNAAVGDVLERKTRLKARVFGQAPGAAAGSTGSSGGGSYAGSASTASGSSSAVNPANINLGYIWKGGMF